MDTQTAHPLFREPVLQCLDRGCRARNHAQRWAINRREREVLVQEWLHLLLRQGHGEHGPTGQLLHQSPACRHQRQGIFQREHTRQTRGHILTNAVTNHRLGMNPPRHPQLGQRVLDHKERWLGQPRLLELLCGLCGLLRAGI